MQSSIAAMLRVLVMLVCAVGIPALAVSGASWSEILKKFQDFRWPALLNPASASTLNDSVRTPRSVPDNATVHTQISNDERLASQRLAVAPGSLSPNADAVTPDPNSAGFSEVQSRLRQLGATHYLLESWGNERQLYRFCCKVAVGGSANCVRYFEATHDNPLQAMLQVLRRIEMWRSGRE